MSVRRDRMGWTTKILIVAVIVGIYVVVRLAPGYIRNYQLQNVINTATKFYADPAKRKIVSHYFEKKIVEMELPAKVEDFKIIREGNSVTITHEWTYEVIFIPKNPVFPEYKRYIHFKEEGSRELQGN